MSETRGLHNREIVDVDEAEEEVDVEQVILTVQEKCADFISSDNAGQFEEIFDVARRAYGDSEPEVRIEWDLLFENLASELIALEDEDDIATVLQNYVKKANVLG